MKKRLWILGFPFFSFNYFLIGYVINKWTWRFINICVPNESDELFSFHISFDVLHRLNESPSCELPFWVQFVKNQKNVVWKNKQILRFSKINFSICHISDLCTFEQWTWRSLKITLIKDGINLKTSFLINPQDSWSFSLFQRFKILWKHLKNLLKCKEWMPLFS